MSGRVVFKPEHGREKVLRVGTSGQFNVTLREGVYTALEGTGWFPNCRGNAGNRSGLWPVTRSKLSCGVWRCSCVGHTAVGADENCQSTLMLQSTNRLQVEWTGLLE